MSYAVKVVTKCADATLTDEEQVATIHDFFFNGLKNYPDLAAVRQLRQSAVDDGVLLARGTVIDPTGKELHSTMVWKSAADYATFRANPIMTSYITDVKKTFVISLEIM